MVEAYDPLDYANLAKSVVQALLSQAVSPLPPSEAFIGSGVYALYYTGNLRCYAEIASPQFQIPIYVGKAVPMGARKGRSGAPGRALCGRLAEHAESIRQVENLNIDDFGCRFLVVVPVWITLAERLLLTHYRPLWNTIVDGFGNHAPGAGRSGMRRPRWDILHPGRLWAQRLAAQETAEDIIKMMQAASR